MKKRLARVDLGTCKTVVTFLPLIFAFVGYTIYYKGEDVFSALFSSLRIYLASTDYSLSELRTFPAYEQAVMRICFEVWANQRMAEGWRYGPVRDDTEKRHPGLVPYEELPESEKEYDRRTSMESLKLIYKFGYRIVENP